MSSPTPTPSATLIQDALSWQPVATFAAAVVAGFIALLSLIWGIRQYFLSRNHADRLSAEQIASTEMLAARTAFQARLEWGVSLIESKSARQRFIGAETLKVLIEDPHATADDQAYALRISQGLEDLR